MSPPHLTLHLNSASGSPARPVSTSPEPYHHQSQSPFRYVHFDEKRQEGSSTSRPYTLSQPSPLLIHTVTLPPTRDEPCPSTSLLRRLQPWIPVILYAATSLGFLIAIAFFKTQVFERLDELSTSLKSDPTFGYAVLFLLIFLTTFPPLPMYSTLIILSGYTFGTIPGFILSYTAALSGALTVFLLSRHLRPIQTPIQHWLDHTPASIRAAVRAIEKRPRLLFLVRLAPYPYNVMNCLLGAAAPSLSVGRYVGCTALSLIKVVVHTGVGSGIHSFKDYHKDKEVGVLEEEEETNSERLARVWTIVGIVMCVVIFVYLSWCARRAVNEELGDEAQDDEERQRFLEDEEMGQVQRAPLQVSNN